MDSMLKSEFIEFLNDPGMGISHPRKKALWLEDIFIFPDLLLTYVPPGAQSTNVLSSEELLNIDTLPQTISISGPEDSGKTSLLKILHIHYAKNGLYPLYLDGNVTGPIGERGLWELIRVTYEKQYEKSYFTGALTSSAEKKICLFDNFETALSEPELAQNLLESFRSLILTSEMPLLNALEPSDKSSIITAELCELGPLLRHKFYRKWHELDSDTKSGSGTPEIETKIQSSSDLIEKTLKTVLVPSYPSVLISMLYSTDTDDEYELWGGTYAHHLEHLITKPLREYYKEAQYKEIKGRISDLAYTMFTDSINTISGSELKAILGTGYEKIIPDLIRARVLIEGARGYGFKYDHGYHYFTACYLEKNLSSENAKLSVQNLCRDLGETDSTGIMLFLVHLSDDPFITEEINRALKSNLADVPEDRLDDRVRELDEIIESIISSEQKDKKLREIRAEYEVSAKRPWAPERFTRGVSEHTVKSNTKDTINVLRQIRKDLGLLRVSGALLEKRLAVGSQDSEINELRIAYYRMWLRSLSRALLRLTLKPYERPENSGTYESSKPPAALNEEDLINVERVTIALKIVRLYIKELSKTLGSAAPSEIFSQDDNKVSTPFIGLIDLFTKLRKRDDAVKPREVETLLSARTFSPFQKELIREVLYLHYQNLYHGEELKEMISKLDSILER